MKTKLIIFSVLGLLLQWQVLFAQGAVNELTIPVTDGRLGNEMSVPVYLTNDDEIVAVQLKMTIPQGAQINTSAIELSDRKDDHTISAKSLGNNAYLIVIFSSTNKPLKGNSGVLFRLPVVLPMTWDEESTHPLIFNELILTSKDGDNIATGSDAGALFVIAEPRPDITVKNITFDKAVVSPGENINISWQVENIGDAITGSGWNEQVVVIAENSEQAYLGTTYHNQQLASGGIISRQAEFTVPQPIGIEEEVNIRVKLTPNTDMNELAAAQGNNTGFSTEALEINRKLIFELPTTAISEKNTSSIRCKLLRSGSWVTEQTFSLRTDDPNRITIPASVTIPAGQSGSIFYLKMINNDVLDVDSIVNLYASGSGFDEISGPILIDDDELATLTLRSSEEALEEGDEFTLTIERERISPTPLLVYLSSDHPKRFTFPAQVTIPAGEKTVAVNITANDDNIPDVNITAKFTAKATKHNDASCQVVLNDDDLPEIELTLSTETISESAGPLAIMASLRRLSNTGSSITVNISDDSGGDLFYSASKLTLAAGVQEARFTIGIVDNSLLEGDREIEVTAAIYLSSCNCSATGTEGGTVSKKLTILDDDGPSLKITASQSMLPEGKTDAAILTVTRNTPPNQDLTVQISSDHDADLRYEKTVVIPAGQQSVDVPVSVNSNQNTEGDRTVVFTVTADNYTKGICWVIITDQTLPDAIISSLLLSQIQAEVESSIDITLVLSNEGAAALPMGVPVKVYAEPNKTEWLNFTTPKRLAVGESDTITKSVTLPNIPGTYAVYAVINENNTVRELMLLNNTSEKATINLLPKFTATATTDKAIYKQGESVLISGQLTGSKTTDTEVEVYIINKDSRQTISCVTDGEGKYEVRFEPTHLSGHFVVGACYPKEGLTTEQASFDVYGIERTKKGNITHDILIDETYEGSIVLKNTGVLNLTNLRAEILSVPENRTIVFNSIINVNSGEIVTLNYTLEGNSISEGTEWEQIKIRILSDESDLLDMTLLCYFRSPRGQLKASISTINTTMTKGVSRDYSFEISNIGKGETGKITLNLPQTTWLRAITPVEMASMQSGDTTTVILRFTPTDDMQLNVPVTGAFGINCANGSGLPISFNIEPVSESTGKLVVDVCDEYTYYTEEAPHVEGAKVTVRHPVSNKILYQGLSGSDGLFVVEDIPEGYYQLEVSAEKHDNYRNNILVDPGRETQKVVNLSFQAITIDWKVKETEIEDEYEIITTVEFETNVPVPVVTMEVPDKIDLEELMEKGYYVYNAVITNKGLITALDVEFKIPDDSEGISFDYPDIGTFDLKPKESILIPVKIALASETRSNKSLRATSNIDLRSSSPPCSFQNAVRYEWECGPDKKWKSYTVPTQVLVCTGNGGGRGSSSSGWGGGSGSGFPGGSGGGGGYWGGNSSTKSITISDDCDDCRYITIKKLINCGMSFVPVYGCVKGTADCVGSFGGAKRTSRDNARCILTGVACGGEACSYVAAGTVVGLPVAGVCTVIGYIANAINCLVDFTECTPTRSTNGVNASVQPSYMIQFGNTIDIILPELEAYRDFLLEYFGNEVWLSCSIDEFMSLTDYLFSFEENQLIDINDVLLQELRPDSISNEEFVKFIERLNNTQRLLNGETIDENYIDQDLLDQYANIIMEVETKAVDMGYESSNDMWEKEYETFITHFEEGSSSVCASITLQFSQTMTMTRQAFRGTLSVFNGHEEIAMEEVKLNLVVSDEHGNVATSREFQINTESLDAFEGALDGMWSLEAQETGVATILFIPSKYAAPTEPKDYLFGGTLSYIDPFTGLEVTRELSPVTLTVKPSPNLALTYFMQRDILADDPLTADIEPIVPAEFSLLIQNVGAGDAQNVRMVTQQPKIVANEKGLFIDFELLSSQLNGKEHTLALGGSVATDFGTISPQGTTYAQWWFTSTLQGHFTNYDVSATHVTSYGNPDLSLLDTVSIHELIRSVEVPTQSTSEYLTGFLVNDIPDGDDLPDMIYLSDGTIAPVAHITQANCSLTGENQYTLTITRSKEDWNYGFINDPTNGRQNLLSVTRVGDNAAISLRNFWQTYVTLRDGKDPLYQNKLHFTDKFENETEQYILTFEPRPDITLAVESFGGIPASVSEEPVTELTVRFNKSINPESFTTDDLTLICQGKYLDVSQIIIEKKADNEYSLDISAVSLKNGYYVLTVQTAGITDYEGYPGEKGKTADWNQYFEGKVSFAATVFPENAGTLSAFSNEYAYGTLLTLEATPGAGYAFDKWTVAEEVLSHETILKHSLLSSQSVTAHFKLKFYEVLIEFDEEKGSVSGGGTGRYEHGKQVSLKATPAAGYYFKGWKIAGESYSANEELDITVVSHTNIEAEFAKKASNVYHLVSGWNWISVNLSGSNMNDARKLFAQIIDDVSIIRTENNLLIYDDITGFHYENCLINKDKSYKLKLKKNKTLTLTGAPIETEDLEIPLAPGWNWISYIPTVEQAVNEVFRDFSATNHEVIKEQDSFSMFNGTQWLGSLTSLIPGNGYMFYSLSDKTLQYNQGEGLRNSFSYYAYSDVDAPWSYDKYKYVDNMNIVVKIYDEHNTPVVQDKYIVGAFAGDECRGIGTESGGYLFVTLHGELAGEEISFKVKNIQDDIEYIADETIDFANTIIGDFIDPMRLTIKTGTAIQNPEGSETVRVYPNPVETTVNVKFFTAANVDRAELVIYDTVGRVIDKVEHKSLDSGQNHIVWNRESAANGIYYCVLNTYQKEQLVFSKTQKLFLK
ncbi:T9SS type A sorting domain-containing protein [Bacteroidales bacterium OttesenSCG-928-A17]|nr:T9SS type A sorting domain-containing protein [Bacteroidales bacterium OttesenSCG-928-A17]